MKEGWMKNDKGWIRNDEGWMMKNDDFKLLIGFKDKQTFVIVELLLQLKRQKVLKVAKVEGCW